MPKPQITPEQVRAIAKALRAITLVMSGVIRDIADFIEHCEHDELLALIAAMENASDDT